MKPAVILVVLLLMAAVGRADEPPSGAALAEAAEAVFKRHCLRCHSGEGSEGGDFSVLNLEHLTAAELLVPSELDKSLLYQRMADNDMPPRSIPIRPQPEEIAAVSAWIAAGAPPFPLRESRPFLELSLVMSAVRDHLRWADPDDRPYLRYFTLHHLHNNPRMSAADLRLYRAALSKAINSLSWKNNLVLPQAIDETAAFAEDQQQFLQATLFVIDVRDLDWDRHDQWHRMLKYYPYGLSYRTHPDEGLRRLNDELRELAESDLPIVRADWFVATATRPPLYHEMLQLPESEQELEHLLKVDARDNFLQPKPERFARGGIAKSGVSGQNRLLERHAAAYGAYWKSYDFRPFSPRTKLTRYPLGPLNLFPPGQHPYPHNAFQHDGGEMIFHLPNGLQGYFLTDGHGTRIDEGPIDVVSDPLKTSGTPLIVNGVSCMSCHKQGTIDFADMIRTGSSLVGEPELVVRRIYPEQKHLDALLAEDRRRFMTALTACTGPFLQQEADAEKPLTWFPEPIGEVARQHRLVYLDLQTIACELNLADAAALRNALGDRKLKQLGLESLLRADGVISRGEWEASDGVSLMQEVARELRCTPVNVY